MNLVALVLRDVTELGTEECDDDDDDELLVEEVMSEVAEEEVVGDIVREPELVEADPDDISQQLIPQTVVRKTLASRSTVKWWDQSVLTGQGVNQDLIVLTARSWTLYVDIMMIFPNHGK